MEWLKRNPFFYSILCLMLGFALFGVWMNARERSRLLSLKDKYERKADIYEALVRAKPAPTEANYEMLLSNFEVLRAAYFRSQESLNLNTFDSTLFFGAPPKEGYPAYSMIASYIDKNRKLASANGISMPEDLDFGMAYYPDKGPEGDVIATVHRQAKIMEALLQMLFDSGISEFVYIKREYPVDGHNWGDESSERNVSDFFDLAPEVSVGHEGIVESLAFRLGFKGQSISLRSFLNRITNSSLPFAINGIEAHLAGESREGISRAEFLDNPFLNPEEEEALIETAKIPIISGNETLFEVTLEFLEQVPDLDDKIAAMKLEGGRDA